MGKVSIIMPAYNAERYIAKAIQSVIEQSFTDWELIVIDDASVDGTAAIVQQIAKQDTRIHFYQNAQNQGVALTRNCGLDMASGEFIAFLDSDDLWTVEKLQLQLNQLRKSKADLCFTAYANIKEDGKMLSQYNVPQIITYTELLKENVIGCSTVLIRRNSLKNRSFETEFSHEDYALWLQLLRLGCKVIGINKVLVYYRLGGRSKHKVSAAKNRWHIYRKEEKIALPFAVLLLVCYAINGVRKNIQIHMQFLKK